MSTCSRNALTPNTLPLTAQRLSSISVLAPTERNEADASAPMTDAKTPTTQSQTQVMRRAGQHGSKRGSGGGCSRARSSSRPLSVQSPSSARGACPELVLWYSGTLLGSLTFQMPRNRQRRQEKQKQIITSPPPVISPSIFRAGAWHSPPSWLAPGRLATGLSTNLSR